MSKVKCWVQ